MAFLLTKEGQPLLLSDGQRVRKGSLVVDSIFGEGVVTSIQLYYRSCITAVR